MANINDLLGAFMQGNLAPSGANRLGGALEQLQRGLGGTGAANAGGSGNLLGGLLESALKGGLGGAGASNRGIGGSGAGGGLGALAGALLGGGQPGARAGAGSGAGIGALTLIAGIAMQALQAHAQKAGAGPAAGGPGAATGFGANMGAPGPWSGGDLPVALRQPRDAAEQGALEDTARLVLEGMINAAKADGQVSPEEMQRIVGKLGDAGSDPALQQWVMTALAAPLDVRAFAAALPNQEVAAEVYAASLLAIEVDTEAERRYLRDLAAASGLHPLVVGQIHQTLGVPALA